MAPFTGLGPRAFGKLVTVLRCQGVEADRKGRPWSLPPEDRALLVAAYWRTNLTMRQLAALSGVSKSAAGRITGLGPRPGRQLNRALHTITLIRMRLAPATKAYLTRRIGEGKTSC